MGNITSECLLRNIIAQINFAEATRKFGESKNIEVFINNRAYAMLARYCEVYSHPTQTFEKIYGHRLHVVNDKDNGFPEFWLGEKCRLREFES